MLMLDDDTYIETKNIALGRAHRKPLAEDFVAWAAREYAIKVLDVQLQKLEKPPSFYPYKLSVIIANTEDYQKTKLAPWENNEQLLTEMARQFLHLAVKHERTENILPNDLWVACYDFSREAMTEANWKATKEFKPAIRHRYPIVWEIMGMFDWSVIFYFSDDAIAENKENGVSQAITDAYYSMLQKYDDLNYFTRENMRLLFDSKENVDKHYEGSLFYYSRG